jgi:hypothetical protein
MKMAFAVVAVMALAVPAHAGELYRWVDGATIVYSDQPPQDGVALTAVPTRPPFPIVTAPDAPPAETATAEVTAPATPAMPAASAAPAVTEPVVQAGPASVDEILELSGMRPQLPALARSLGAEYLPRPGQLGERDGVRVAQIVARQFAPEPLFAAIRADFRRSVDRTQLEAMASWFRSPLGRKITALEIEASKPEAAPKIAAFAAGLKAAPATAVRLELVQRLDWLTGASEDTTDLALAIAGSIARATAAAAPAEQRARTGLVERRVEEMRGQIAPVIAENVLAQVLYVYAPLTDAELKAYLEFVASPAGRTYARIAHGALVRVVRDVADRTAIEILRAVPPQRWATAQKTAGAAPTR